MIGLKDEFYNRYIVKNDLLKPVRDAFVANGQRYNLFNSAVLELFEFIRMVSYSCAGIMFFCMFIHGILIFCHLIMEIRFHHQMQAVPDISNKIKCIFALFF